MSRQMKNGIKKNSGWMIMAFLVMVTFLCGCSIQAAGKEKKQYHEEEKYYQAIEKEYREELRTFLNQAGYCNSGINMTKVVMTTGNLADVAEGTPEREYTVSIYNKKINQLSSEKEKELMTELVKMGIPEKGCSVSYYFMKNEM